MLLKKELLNNSTVHSYNKKQKNIIGISSLISGLGLLATAGIGYLFYFLVFDKAIISQNALIITSSIALIVSLFAMIFFSFTTMTIGKYGILFPIYIFSSGLGFSSLFAIFNSAELLMIFGLAGLTMFICSILGICLPSKVTMSLMGFATIAMVMLFIVSIAFSLISWFVSSFTIEIWEIVVTVLMAFIAICYNIFLFHSMSKMQDFQNENLDNKGLMLLSLSFGFSLLVSMIQLIFIFSRIFIRLR